MKAAGKRKDQKLVKGLIRATVFGVVPLHLPLVLQARHEFGLVPRFAGHCVALGVLLARVLDTRSNDLRHDENRW